MQSAKSLAFFGDGHPRPGSTFGKYDPTFGHVNAYAQRSGVRNHPTATSPALPGEKGNRGAPEEYALLRRLNRRNACRESGDAVLRDLPRPQRVHGFRASD
jgi:hypothetical protein